LCFQVLFHSYYSLNKDRPQTPIFLTIFINFPKLMKLYERGTKPPFSKSHIITLFIIVWILILANFNNFTNQSANNKSKASSPKKEYYCSNKSTPLPWTKNSIIVISIWIAWANFPAFVAPNAESKKPTICISNNIWRSFSL